MQEKGFVRKHGDIPGTHRSEATTVPLRVFPAVTMSVCQPPWQPWAPNYPSTWRFHDAETREKTSLQVLRQGEKPQRV